MGRPKYSNQILIAASQNLALLAGSMGLSWSTVTIPIFSDPDTCPYETCEENLIPLVGTILLFSSMIGAVIAGPLVNMVGRKNCLLIGSACLTAGWIIVPFSTSLIQVLVSRIVSGFGFGFMNVPFYAYMGEIISFNIRGAVLSIGTLSLTFGGLLMFIFGAFFSFRTISIIVLVAAAMHLVITFFIPESPTYLVMKGQIEKAETILKWLRQTNDDKLISEEIQLIQTSLENTPKSSIKELFTTRANRRPFIIVMVIYALQGLNGTQVINIYATSIFGTITDSSLRPEIQTIIMGVFSVIPAIIAPLIIDKWGRRIILITGFGVTAIFLVFLGIFFYLDANTFEESGMYSWIPLAFIIVILLASGTAVPVNGPLNSEIFQDKVRAIGMTFGFSFFTFFGFLASLAFGYLMNIWGIYILFWFFSVVCAVLVIYVYFQLPETMGKNSTEIREFFEK